MRSLLLRRCCPIAEVLVGWIEICHDLVEFSFLLLLVCAVLFYPVVFETCGLRTDNHNGTRIDKRQYFVALLAQHLYGSLEASIL